MLLMNVAFEMHQDAFFITGSDNFQSHGNNVGLLLIIKLIISRKTEKI